MTDRSQARGLALIPIALLLHNAEEGLTVRPEMRDHLSRLLGHMVQLPAVEQYHVALAVVTLAGFGLLLLSRFRRDGVVRAGRHASGLR